MMKGVSADDGLIPKEIVQFFPTTRSLKHLQKMRNIGFLAQRRSEYVILQLPVLFTAEKARPTVLPITGLRMESQFLPAMF